MPARPEPPRKRGRDDVAIDVGDVVVVEDEAEEVGEALRRADQEAVVDVES